MVKKRVFLVKMYIYTCFQKQPKPLHAFDACFAMIWPSARNSGKPETWLGIFTVQIKGRPGRRERSSTSGSLVNKLKKRYSHTVMCQCHCSAGMSGSVGQYGFWYSMLFSYD